MINLWVGFVIINLIIMYFAKDEIEQAAILDPELRRKFVEAGVKEEDILSRVHIMLIILTLSGPILWLLILLNIFKH